MFKVDAFSLHIKLCSNKRQLSKPDR